MAKLILFAVLVVSCGAPRPESICENPFGLVVTDLPKGWDCSDIVRTQTILAAELQKTKGDPRLKKPCDLSEYTLVVHDAPSWVTVEHDGTFDVMGVTYCSRREIHIGNTLPHENALPHEIVHAMQNCDPMYVPNSVNDSAHEGWFEEGIEDALDATWYGLAPEETE